MHFLIRITGTSVMSEVFNPKTKAYSVGISKKSMDQKHLARNLRMRRGYLKITLSVNKTKSEYEARLIVDIFNNE